MMPHRYENKKIYRQGINNIIFIPSQYIQMQHHMLEKVSASGIGTKILVALL